MELLVLFVLVILLKPWVTIALLTTIGVFLLGVKKLSKKNKLRILRALALVALNLFEGMCSKKHELAAKWLIHYLEGSGTDMTVPKWVIAEAKEVMINVFKREHKSTVVIDLSDYDIDDFYSVKTLFYLVGGFTCNRSGQEVSGQDIYDWNKNVAPSGAKTWYGASVKIPKKAWRFFGKIFGEEYFFFSNGPALSNKLWADMALVGAKPFKSKVRATIFTEEEVVELDQGRKGYILDPSDLNSRITLRGILGYNPNINEVYYVDNNGNHIYW